MDLETEETVEEIKRRVRTCLKDWHPDTGRGDSDIMRVLTTLVANVSKDTLNGWPDGSFETGAKVVFPPLPHSSNGNRKEIFLPATPREFIALLEQIKRSGSFPEKDFSRVELKFVGGRSTEQKAKVDEDPTLAKFQKFIIECDTFEKLQRAFDLFNLYSEEQLLSIGTPELMDQRASFVFTREIWLAKTENDIYSLMKYVEKYPFFSEGNRSFIKNTIENKIKEQTLNGEETIPDVTSTDEDHRQAEKEARKDFVLQVRNAETPEILEQIAKSVDSYTFLNRGELGVVRSVISRKMKVFGRI